MTTIHHAPARDLAWPPFAAAGVGAALVLTAVGTFWDLTGNDTGPADDLVDFLPVIGVVLVAAAITFAVVTHKPTATTSLVLGILAVLTVVVAWTGLPCVLAAGSAATALAQPSRGPARVGLALSALAVVGAVLFAVAG
jgi:hypothetical protein